MGMGEAGKRQSENRGIVLFYSFSGCLMGLSDGALDLMRLALVRSTKGSLKRAKQYFGFATPLRYAGCLSILRSEPFPPARHLP